MSNYVFVIVMNVGDFIGVIAKFIFRVFYGVGVFIVGDKSTGS